MSARAGSGVALLLGGPGADPGHEKDEQPHDEPGGVAAGGAQTEEASDEKSGVDEGRDEQEDVEVPASLEARRHESVSDGPVRLPNDDMINGGVHPPSLKS